MTEASPPPKSRAKPPRRISAQSLENSALYYLQRYDSTAENLRRVLTRKVRRAAMHPEATVDPAAASEWIAAVVAKMQRLGYVDDTRTATAKARGLFAKGAPPATIRRRLALAGAGEDAIDAALGEIAGETMSETDLTRAAAITLARRKRLGPYRPEADRPDRRQKDMATLARAGFDFETARRIIDAPDVESLEDDD
jgi:regulatory protein